MKALVKKALPRPVELAARKFLFNCRLLDSQSRALPDFVIVGAQKAGTTSLYHYLSQHPQIFPSFEKEVHYFDGGLQANVDTYTKGLDWYKANFPRRETVGEHGVVGEASPLYMFHPLVPKRIAEALPEIKIIAVLRNPTERAISHYFHERKKGHENLPISEALANEEYRTKSVLENSDFSSKEFIHYTYKSRGLYKPQLERFYDLFPRNQIHIVESSEFFQAPHNILSGIYDFLNVDTEFKLKDLEPQNIRKRDTKVSQEIYNVLDAYFLPHNKSLYELIGKTFNW